jgi:uracil-DNA glycosylase family 4
MTEPTVVRKHPDAECEKCDLYDDGVFVPSKHPVSLGMPKIAVVGEAPGLQEAAKGEPFIGPSGRLLNTVLEHHGIKREEVFLTNACLCRPRSNATPSAVAVAACGKRLIREIEDAGVDVVLSLGNTPSRYLLGTKKGILETRIGPRRPAYRADVEIVPTVHPAYCLRNGDAFADFLFDVGKVKAPVSSWTAPEWASVDDEEGALHVLAQLTSSEYPKLVVDIETGIDKDKQFDHPNHFQMLCVGFCYAKGKCVVLGENALKSEKVLAALKALLGTKKKFKIMQNGKFDCSGLYPLIANVDVDGDTMLAHYVLDERPGGHGLEKLGIELLGAPDWKHEIAPYLGENKNYANIPRPILYKYNAYDDAVTWDLWELFEKELDKPVVDPDRAMEGFKTLRGLHDFLVRAANQLKFVELNGITFDRAYSLDLSKEFTDELMELEEKINEVVGVEYDARLGGINPRSPQQVTRYLHDKKIRVRDTAKETLERLRTRYSDSSEVGQFLDLLLRHRYQTKRHGTFIKGLRSRTYRGRVYTTYLLHGTTSGRLASRNPNLQNVVRDKRIRNQFTASREGYVLGQADFKQAEGRVITVEAQDEYLRDIFSDPDRDLFDELGKDLYQHEPPFHKEERIRVKAYFYGLGYGRTHYSIAQEYKIPVGEAEEGVRVFKSLIPATVQWQLETQQQILDGKDLMTAFGRSRRFMLITNENRDDVLKEGLSFKPQSTSSDICLSAFIRLRPMLRGIAWFRLLIHDALVWECKEEDKEAVAATVRRVMIEEAAKYTTYVPFDVDISYGTRWGEL